MAQRGPKTHLNSLQEIGELWRWPTPQSVRPAASPHVRLRRARVTDVDAVLRLEHATFSLDRLSRRSIRCALVSPSQCVLTLDEPGGRLIGSAIMHFRSGARLCRLHSIAIAAAFSRQGLGGLLLTACEQEARRRGRHRVRLEVRLDNRSALRFYLQHGYQIIGRKSRFYEDGSDAFHLESRSLIKSYQLSS